MEIKRHRMTEHTFKAIKLMLKGGATPEEINEHYPVSKETLRRVRRSGTFMDYIEMQRVYSERSAENRRKKAEPEQVTIPVEMIPIPAVDPVDTVISAIMREQTAILRAVDEKIGFLLKELTGNDA